MALNETTNLQLRDLLMDQLSTAGLTGPALRQAVTAAADYAAVGLYDGCSEAVLQQEAGDAARHVLATKPPAPSEPAPPGGKKVDLDMLIKRFGPTFPRLSPTNRIALTAQLEKELGIETKPAWRTGPIKVPVATVEEMRAIVPNWDSLGAGAKLSALNIETSRRTEAARKAAA